MTDDNSTFTLNLLVILIFLGLAAIAATVMLMIGRMSFGRWYSWFALYLSALAGGLIGVGILFFGAKFEEIRSSKDVSSINPMLIMVLLLELGLMIVLPLVTLRLRHRKKKIRELEEEIQRLKGGMQ